MGTRLNRRHFLVTSAGLTILTVGAACNEQAISVPTAGPETAKSAASPKPVGQPAAPPAVKSSSPPGVPQVPRSETLIMSVSDDINQMPDSQLLNPFIQGAKRTGWHFMFEPLYFYNPWWTPEVSAPPGLTGKEGEIPYLATGYEYSKDYRELVIQLRTGVTWSDGKPFTARDVAFTLNMLKENAPKLNWSNDMKKWVKDALAADDHTVKISLNVPAPRFMFEYFQWHQDAGFPIVPEHIFQGKDPLTFTNFDLANGWPIGTGPWRLIHSAPEQKVFERRDDWWGAKTNFHPLPKMKRIIVLPHYEDPKLVQLLSAGDVDATHNIQQPADAEVALSRNPNLLVRTPDKSKPWGWLDWWPNALGFNCSKPPFDDPDIRWAINYAINRKQIVEVGFKGDTQETLLPFPRYQPMLKYFDLVKPLLTKYPVGEHDPARTSEIMQSKGYTKDGEGFWTKDGKRFSMVILTSPGFFTNFAPVIVAQLRQAGFDASFKSPSNAGTLMNTGELDAFLQGHAGSLQDPHTTLDHYHSRNSAPTGEAASRPYRWKNPEFDSLVDQLGERHPSDPGFDDLYFKAMEIWLKNLPDIPTVQWYLILPVNSAHWKGWPDAQNPYCAPSLWHRGSAALVINTIEPV